MIEGIIETSYPLTFRQEDSVELGKHLKNRHSVVLVGMRKVGISNFLRFFLNNIDIPGTYIKDYKKHLFIAVDLNDLVEIEIIPFWTLTLKRLVDLVDKSPIDIKVKKRINNMFLESIQLQDLFFTIDSVRIALSLITEQGYSTTLFFLRFDRIKDVVTSEFFANLEGIKAFNQQVSFVFTSYRSLKKLIPQLAPSTSWSVFFRNMYLKPAKREDVKIIFDAYKKRSGIKLKPEFENYFFDLVDGYTQYLQLALIFLHERGGDIKTKEDLYTGLINDERISFQSEELWETLDKKEQDILIKIAKKENILPEEKREGAYLWDTGFIVTGGVRDKIFSLLFEEFVVTKSLQTEIKDSTKEFSKKENILFNFLLENKDKLCEREDIIEVVWPEEEELGVSDWAVDKLVARVRGKLKDQSNRFEILTVKTRGYKLTEAALS